MAMFHFFTDTNLPLSQSSGDAFGPQGVDGSPPNDKYRVSSMHRAAALNPTAYAVCNGIVCVQEISGSSPALVNLILKPLDRPPLNFVPISYYVYKGIRKDSLFDSTGNAIAADDGTNDLRKAIWDSANKRHTSAPASALGIDLSAAFDATLYGDAAPIDNLFFRTGGAQFPAVAGGWKIGIFDKNLFGLMILLDGIGWRHELALTRGLEDHVRVQTLTPNEPPDQVFAHWRDKERVLRFMDPCAFYGSFYGSRIRAKTSTGSFDVKKGDAIYTDVLASFSNKNTTYLDIRNEHNNSFDYFNNYHRKIEVAFDANSARSQLDYYGSGWPILNIDGSRFPAGNATGVNVLRVALPAGDNVSPLLYISQGYKPNGSPAFPAALSSAEKIAHVNVQGAVIDEVKLAFPNAASAGKAIASYARLKYFKRFDASQTPVSGPPTTIVAINYLDNLFYPLELETVLSGSAPVKSVVHDEEIYVDARADLGFDFIGKVGFAIEGYALNKSNVTLFAYPSFVISGDGGAKTIPLSIVGEAIRGTDPYLNLLLKKFPGTGITLGGIELTPLVRAMSLVAAASDADHFTTSNFAHFVALVFDKQAYQDLVARARTSFAQGYRVYLGVKDAVTQQDSKHADYTTNEVVLRGYVLNGNALTATEITSGPTANVKVYSK
jgi:hypothetical protein